MAQVTIGGGRVVCEMDEAAVDEYKQVVGWLQQALASRDDAYAALKVALAERDTARETHRGLVAERDAAIAERAHYGDTMSAKLGQCENERDALRAALQSLVDGKSEFDIEYDTGMPADEARRIMDLAYNRK